MLSAMGTHALISVLAQLCFSAHGEWESPHIRQLLIDTVSMVLSECSLIEH